MSRLTWIALLVLTLAAAGCDKRSNDGGAESEKKEEKVPEPYQGELSHERIEGAKEVVKPFDEWDSGFAKIKAELGEPTFTDGNRYYWGFADDEKCTDLSIEKEPRSNYDESATEDEMMVGTTSGPNSVASNVTNGYADCLEHAGQKPPEDPNVPGPPEDGSAVSVQTLRTGVEKAPSKWLGESVTVHGKMNSTTSAKDKNSDDSWVTISVGADDDLQTTIGCGLPKNTPSPLDNVVQGTPVEASGTVSDTFGGHLEDCTIAVLESAQTPSDSEPASNDAEEPPAEEQ